MAASVANPSFGINPSTVPIQSLQQTTTTTTNAYPIQQQAPLYAVYDKPADRRLRPWIIIGSLLLGVIAACMIVFTFIKSGTLGSLWGVFAAGIALGVAAAVGFFTGWTLRPAAKALFFWVILAAWIGAVAVLIVNGALLNHHLNNQCGSLSRATVACQDIRQYHYIVFAAFGIPTALWVPTYIVAAGYMWRTASLMRKGAGPAAPVNNVGRSAM